MSSPTRASRLLLAFGFLAAGLGGFALLLWHCTPKPAQPAPSVVVLPPPAPTETPEQIAERKRLFLQLLLPIVQTENARLLGDRRRIDRIERELAGEDEISREDFDWLKQMAVDYDLDPKARRNPEFFASLRRRVDLVPASLLIAQAALESGWGRSEVTRENHNFFGHYCFGKGCGTPAPGQGDLRRFETPGESVIAYIHNLNSHGAYQKLRRAREQARLSGRRATGETLAGHITAYSERGAAYVAEVRAIIRANDLDALPDLPE